MTSIHDTVPKQRSKYRNALLGKNKASASVKNGQKLASEDRDKNALSLCVVRLADEFDVEEIDGRLVISTLKANYGLALSSMSRWRDVGLKVRLATATSAMNKSHQRTVVFSVVFSDRIQQTLTRKAKQGKGVSAYVNKKLREGLKRSGLSLDQQVYWFTLEAKHGSDPDCPPYHHYHVHGMIVIPDVWSDGDMEKALKRVGGSEKHFDNQVDIRPLTFNEGWLNYVTKQTAEMQRHVNDKCYGMSGACKNLSQQLYAKLKGHIGNLHL